MIHQTTQTLKMYSLNGDKRIDSRFLGRFSQFRLFEIPKGHEEKSIYSSELRIVFVLKGKFFIKYQRKDLTEQMVSEEQIIFIPKHTNGKVWILEDTSFIVYACNIPHPIAHKRAISWLFPSLEINRPPEEKLAYSLPITSNIKLFLNLLEIYIKRCSELQRDDMLQYIHQTKEEELYSLFQMEFTSNELITFLSPGLTIQSHFHSMVLSSFKQCRTVKELAEKCGYDRSKFTALFKECFEETPYKWINDRTKELIKKDLTQDNTRIKDLVLKYNFSSFSHFTTFCYRNFGKSPSQLKKELTQNSTKT